jgi:hypothetical protein
MSESTPEKPSLLERVKDWAEGLVHHEEAAHPKLFAEAVQRIHDLEAEVAKVKAEALAEVAKLRAEFEALAAQVAPAAEADVKAAASAVAHDVEQAVQSAVAPSSTPPA